ncbi:MAG: cbb3-type cytochrome c oxidase subunit I [Lysobacterales bacterium]
MTKIDDLFLSDTQRENARRWLQVGVTALAGSGLFAILLVASRTPGIQGFFPWLDFFRTALVVHVDLSVLVWFLAFAGVLQALLHPGRAGISPLAVRLAWAGLLAVCVTPFTGDAGPILNNYVPVLQHPLFHSGLALIAAGVLLNAFATLRAVALNAPVEMAVITGSIGIIFAIGSFAWTLSQLDSGLPAEAYYEFLFWGGGHAVQFAWVQFMLAAWLLSAGETGVRMTVRRTLLCVLVLAGAAPLLAVPFIHAMSPVDSAESRLAFIRLMQFGGGIAPIPLGLLLLYALIRSAAADRPQKPVRNALWASLVLFGAGGLIAIAIRGVTTTIPAHYHGSIVGVTLAFMGLAYALLPRFGYRLGMLRTATWQPLVYGAGQLLHISGLALSGMLGIQRKTAGSAQALDELSKILTMAVMGLGGLFAIVGGAMFVIVMLAAFYRGKVVRES